VKPSVQFSPILSVECLADKATCTKDGTHGTIVVSCGGLDTMDLRIGSEYVIDPISHRMLGDASSSVRST